MMSAVNRKACFEEAMQQLHAGDPVAAAELCRATLADSPDDVDHLTLLGVALISCRDPVEALPPLQRAAELAPRFARARENLGQALLMVGRLDEAVSHLVASVKAGDYVALLAYITRNPENDRRLAGVRRAAATATQVATTVGFGPRFLHSTGQLHKGGANNGVFVSITADDRADAAVPGEDYSFSVLKEAQARGDWGALRAKGRRALHLHLRDLAGGLKRLEGGFRRAAKA